jgi:hypothetical protein
VVKIREMLPADAGWAAALMDQRRQVYAAYSPVFWRPARDVTAMHAKYLSKLIASDNYLSLRTDDGFMLGRIQPTETQIDDFAVTEPGRWNADGTALMQGPGFTGSFGSAPAVYDPGGPVLHVDHAQDDADLASMEEEAVSMGAVLLVLPTTPGADRVGELLRRGWTVASDWYLGRPSPA